MWLWLIWPLPLLYWLAWAQPFPVVLWLAWILIIATLVAEAGRAIGMVRGRRAT